jgi:protein TonB
MSYQALLFCPDEKTARVVTQVLTELDFMVEPCNETFAAVKKLMAQHFDAVVVDCDNEQNATLLFKSARNSAPNQNSLSVAVVEGQSGVAKAFRIGANLVLTKPINVEQSKGTLRVARGLLRKADATKPASPFASPMPPVSATVEHPPASSPLTARPISPLPVRQATPPPQAADSAFEVEREEEPKPEATEAALLESMPDPMGAAKTQLSPTFGSKELPWQPVAATPSVESAVAPIKHDRLPEPLSFGGTKIDSAGPAFGLGAAAAPAPAKEPSFATSTPAPQPLFGASSEEDAKSSSGNGKNVVFAAVAALILAAAGYYGWPHLRKASSTSASNGVAIEQPTAAPQAAQTMAQTEAAGAPVESSNATTVPATHEQVIAPDTTHAVQGSQASPVSSKPSPVTKISAEDSVSEPKSETPALTPAPIVVKNEQHAPAKPPVADTTQPAAPALGIASTPNDKAIAGLLTSTPARVPKPATETLKVSQGVSQGLLVRRVQPTYPPQALQMRVQGAVILDATIGKDGSIVNVKQVSGEPVLVRAAVDAVKQWKYKPYYLNGEPVEITTQITVNFRLP